MPRTHVQAPMWHPGDLGLLLHSFGNQFQSHTHPKRPKTSPGYRFQKLTYLSNYLSSPPQFFEEPCL